MRYKITCSCDPNFLINVKKDDIPFALVIHQEGENKKKHVFTIEDKEDDCKPCNICNRDCCLDNGHLVGDNEICCDECYEEIIEETKK